MKKCVLVSFFNSHNLGDCIIADTLYKSVSEKFITVTHSYSGNPNVITDINNISNTNSLRSRNLRAIMGKALKKIGLNKLINLYRTFKQSTSTNQHSEFETKIQDADILVIGGGNMIFDIDKYSNSYSRFNNLISIAKKNKIKVFVISIGIGPFATLDQEKKAVDALKKCDYITFRDQKSFDIYARHTNDLKNVFISIDPVFFLPYSLKSNVSKVIGINVFNSKLIRDNQEKYNQLIEGYAKVVDGIREKSNDKVVLFSTDLSDYPAIHDVYNRLSKKHNIEIREINGFNSLIELYSQMSVLIGARMHSMIIAYTQYIPVIGISWQQKVDAFFDIIESKDVYNYNTIEVNSESIITTCMEKINNKKIEKTLIKEKLNSIRATKSIDDEILLKLSKN